MKRKAKIAWYFYVMLLIPIISSIGLVLLSESGVSTESTLFVLIVFALVLSSFVNSYYKLENDYLLIKLGMLKRKIPYQSIDKAEFGKSPNVLKSSFNHVGIVLQCGMEVMVISTTDDQAFLDELSKRMEG